MALRRAAAGLLGAGLLLVLTSCITINNPPPVDPPTTPITPGPTQTADNPSPGEVDSVKLYLPNANADGFVTKLVETDGSAADIIAQLVANQGLPTGINLLNFTMDGYGLCTADLNDAFRAAAGVGTAAEYLRIGAVVNTLLTFFGQDGITLTIEGGVLETGHNYYDYPLSFYDDQLTHFAEPLELSDLPNTINSLPDAKAQENLFRYLAGYWNATDHLFVGFFSRGGEPHFRYGVWESEGSGPGELVSVTAVASHTVELSYFFPAREPSMMDDGHDAYTVTLRVNLEGIPQDGKINIKNASQGSGDWYTYAWAGATMGEAYDNLYS